MTALGYVTTTAVVTGYRAWRVMPYTRLDGTETVRLCAMGTNGLPKVWEPRVAAVAVCSDYSSHHQAPWPDHECGFWALKRPESARRRLITFTKFDLGDPVGYAFGPVSLWGRVIEHEHGWRGQYAYPYALTIESTDERVARVIRDTYAVDVEWAGGDLFEKAKERAQRPSPVPADSFRAELKEIDARLNEIGAALDEAEAPAAPKRKTNRAAARDERIAEMGPVPDVASATDDEVLLAILVHVVADHAETPSSIDWYSRYGTTRDAKSQFERAPTFVASDVAEALLARRGVVGELARSYWPVGDRGYDIRIRQRTGFAAQQRNVLKAMRRMREAGLVDRGRIHRHSSRQEWRLTAKGLRRLAALDTPGTVTLYEGAKEDAHDLRAFEVSTAGGERLIAARPPMFVEEIVALKPHWRESRLRAGGRGTKALANWYAKARQDAAVRGISASERVALTHEEVLEALRQTSAHGPVSASALNPQIAPGKVTHSETSWISQALVKLRNDGLAASGKRDGRLVWTIDAKGGA